MNNISVVIYFLILVLFPAQPVWSAENFMSQIGTLLKSPEGREELKKAIDTWTPEERFNFSTGLANESMKKMAPLLPMQIDNVTLWRSLRYSTDTVHMDFVVSDEVLNSSDKFPNDQLLQYLKNYMCTTPVNGFLMIVGYSIFLSYYDSENNFLIQLKYTSQDCN